MRECKRWEPDELDDVRQLYPDYRAIARKLPHRTPHAIRQKAGQLQLSPKHRRWSAKKVSLIAKHYKRTPMKVLLTLFPDETRHGISGIARYFGIRRAEGRSYANTGVPLIDEIRRRASHLGLSMPKVDELAETGTFFAKARWSGRQTEGHQAVARAAAALDGELYVEWDDDV